MPSFEATPPDESRGTEVPRSLETRSCAPPTQKERLPHFRWENVLSALAFLTTAFVVYLMVGLVISAIGVFLIGF